MVCPDFFEADVNSGVIVTNDKSDLSQFKSGIWNSKAFFYHVWYEQKKKTLYRADEKCVWIFFIVEPQSEQVMAEGVFFCDSLDLCYDPCHVLCVIKHES